MRKAMLDAFESLRANADGLLKKSPGNTSALLACFSVAAAKPNPDPSRWRDKKGTVS